MAWAPFVDTKSGLGFFVAGRGSILFPMLVSPWHDEICGMFEMCEKWFAEDTHLRIHTLYFTWCTTQVITSYTN